jgi:glycosyltransferase involved in cell wall biosynthesis
MLAGFVVHDLAALRRGRDVRAYARLLRAHRSGRTDEAEALARALLERDPDLRLPRWIVVGIDARRGALTAAADGLARLDDATDAAPVRARRRELDDALRMTDPAWRPLIAGPTARIVPADPASVMHLLKTSLPDRQSGYTIRSREVLRAQLAAGLHPFVVTPYGHPPDRASGPAPAVETIDGIVHYRLAPGAPTGGLLETERLERTARLAAAVAERGRPAIIHAASGHHGYELALAGLALREHLGLPLVYEVRGLFESSWVGRSEAEDEHAPAERTRRRTAVEDRVLRDVDGVATLGLAMRDELVARGVDPDRIAVVPNGIDPTAFAPMDRDPALVARYGLAGRWVFGYVSNMDHVREGHDLLIEATSRLVAGGRSVACLLVGDGRRRAELEARVADDGLTGSVVFTGQVPHGDVRAHYALLDAFVIARGADRAARFTTPLKPFEAMAMSLPLVVSDLPALTEITEPDRRGLAFPPGDAGALVAVLGRLMDQPTLAVRLGTAGRAWVLAERTWAANGPRYRDLYESVLERFDGVRPVTSSA